MYRPPTASRSRRRHNIYIMYSTKGARLITPLRLFPVCAKLEQLNRLNRLASRASVSLSYQRRRRLLGVWGWRRIYAVTLANLCPPCRHPPHPKLRIYLPKTSLRNRRAESHEHFARAKRTFASISTWLRFYQCAAAIGSKDPTGGPSRRRKSLPAGMTRHENMLCQTL